MRPRLSRRDAEAFAVAVDGHVRGQSDPVFTDRLQELVDVADFVRASSTPTARRDFVADLRTELMAAAHEELSATATTPSRHRRVAEPPHLRRRLTAAASAFVVIGGTLGLVAASAQAMPGDMLYPVKRATEKVELMLRDGAAEGRALLDHAQTRLGEIESLSADPGHDADDLIAQTLADFTADASAGGALLLEAYREDGSPDVIEDLRAFTADAAQRLRALSGVLPSSAASAYADANDTIGGLDTTAFQACPACADGRPVLTAATDLVADVGRVLDTESSGRPDRQADGSTGRSRSPLELPSVDLDLSGTSSDQTTDAPSDPADEPSDDVGPGGDDSTSDPVDELEDVTEQVDRSSNTDTVEEISRPVLDLVKPLAETVGDALGAN